MPFYPLQKLSLTTINRALRTIWNSTELGGGGGGEPFVELTGTTWTGTNAFRLLTGNLDLTLEPGDSIGGFLEVIQDGVGNRTLSINGTPITIGTAAGARTVIGYLQIDDHILVKAETGWVAVTTEPPPDAPTAGVVDDDNDTFDWTNNPLFTALGDYEYTLNGGSSYNTVTAKPIVVGDIDKAIGQVGVRVKAAGAAPASATLYNASAFNASGTPGTWSTLGGGFTITDQDLDLALTPAVAKYSKHLPSGIDGYIEFTVDLGPAAAYGQTVELAFDPVDDYQSNGALLYGIFASYPSNPANPKIYREVNGTTTNTTLDVVDGDILRIERVGSDVIFKHNGTPIHTVNSADTGDLYVKAAASSPNPIRLRGFVSSGLVDN